MDLSWLLVLTTTISTSMIPLTIPCSANLPPTTLTSPTWIGPRMVLTSVLTVVLTSCCSSRLILSNRTNQAVLTPLVLLGLLRLPSLAGLLMVSSQAVLMVLTSTVLLALQMVTLSLVVMITVLFRSLETLPERVPFLAH